MKLRPEVTLRLAKHVGIIRIMALVAWIILMGLMTHLSSSGITTKLIYIQYAIIDIAVPDDSGNLLFDKLTTRLRLAGTINQDDQATAMAISAYGESNPKGLDFEYRLTDGPMVSVSILRPGEISLKSKIPYDPARTYVSFVMGYGSERLRKRFCHKRYFSLSGWLIWTVLEPIYDARSEPGLRSPDAWLVTIPA